MLPIFKLGIPLLLWRFYVSVNKIKLIFLKCQVSINFFLFVIPVLYIFVFSSVFILHPFSSFFVTQKADSTDDITSLTGLASVEFHQWKALKSSEGVMREGRYWQPPPQVAYMKTGSWQWVFLDLRPQSLSCPDSRKYNFHWFLMEQQTPSRKIYQLLLVQYSPLPLAVACTFDVFVYN